MREKKYTNKHTRFVELSALNAFSCAVLVLHERNITYANSGVENVFGYKPEELVGKSTRILYRSKQEFHDIGIDFYRVLENQNNYSKEYYCRHKDGQDILCRVTASIIGDKLSEKRIVAIYENITRCQDSDKALRESEEKYRQTVEGANDGILIVSDGLIKYLNPRMSELCGYAQRELLEASFNRIFSASEAKKINEHYRKRMNGSGTEAIYSTVIRHKSNKDIFVELSARLIVYKGKRANLVVVRDISERRHDQEKIERLNQDLLKSNKRLKKLALCDAHTGLYNYRYLQEIIEAEFYRARRYGHPISALMMDIDYFKSVNDVYGHQFGDLTLKQLAQQLRKMVRKYDIAIRMGGEEFVIISPGSDRAMAVNLGERLLDALNLDNFGNKQHVIKLKLSMAVSSYPEDKIFSGMELISSADSILSKVKEYGGNKVYSSMDIKIQESLSTKKAKSVEDISILEEKIEKLTRRSNQSLIEAVFAFAKTIELKDHYTGEHVERTVGYATEVANALGLSREEVERIRQAAMLHDLGKIGISEKILLKSDKLSKNEFAEIKKHPQIAVEIIRPIQFLHSIIPYILYHHERWDGKGYPNGLKAEEIPLGARIIAIADVYQALISHRPYRKNSFSKEEAIKIIKMASGTQFDPNIVDVFCRIAKKLK
ncbi:MAG: diguanylate cyclase [Candidatus Omnitrophota bacterium]